MYLLTGPSDRRRQLSFPFPFTVIFRLNFTFDVPCFLTLPLPYTFFRFLERGIHYTNPFNSCNTIRSTSWFTETSSTRKASASAGRSRTGRRR